MIASFRRQGGFTLLELLVAMTLMGLLAGVLFGGLSFGTRVWEKGEESLQRLDDIQITRNVIHRALSQAFPYRLPARDGNDDIAFEGAEAAIRFVGPAPAQSMGGGFYRLNFRAESTSEGQHLVLAWVPLDPDAEDLDGDEEDKSAILLKNIARVDFQFFGIERENELPHWVSEWAEVPLLPSLIKVRIEFHENDRRIWPDLIVAPMLNFEPS